MSSYTFYGVQQKTENFNAFWPVIYTTMVLKMSLKVHVFENYTITGNSV